MKGFAWQGLNGQWLVVRERHTHTGYHVEYTYTPDINEASVMAYLPKELRDEPVTAAAVEVTTTVRVIDA